MSFARKCFIQRVFLNSEQRISPGASFVIKLQTSTLCFNKI